MTVALRSDGLEPLDLDSWGEGWVTSGLSIGMPEARQSVSDRPGAHGTIDDTYLMGARAVTLEVTAVGDPSPLRLLLDRLAPFLNPGRVSTLCIADEGTMSTRCVQVKPSQNFSAPWKSPALMNLTVSFRTAGSPFFTSSDLRSVTLLPSAPPTEVGLIPPFTPPLVLEEADDENYVPVMNAGTEAAYWTAQVDGPAEDIAIRNDTTGETVTLTGLDLTAGQTLVIDSYERSVTVDGERRFSAVDPASTWWRVPVGVSFVSAPVSSWSTPAQVWFRWADTYLI